MPPAIAWLLGIIPIVLVVVLVVSRRRARERTEALRRVAESTGLAFEPEADVAAVRALGDSQLFARGHSKRVTNLMTGRSGGEQLAVFDYRYTVGSGQHQHTSTQTVVILPSAKPSLPDLQMAPENPLHKIAEVFGYQDIDLESNPEFSRRYIVRGADQAAVRAALYPGAASYFADHQGWTVEVQSGNVCIYRANSRPRAEDLTAFMAEACAAARSL
jgi:hypothetical protein